MFNSFTFFNVKLFIMENGHIVIYQTDSGNPEIQVTLENETLWLSQRLMAELFDKDTDTIGLHIRNIYAEGELDEKATTEVFSVVQKEGERSVKRKVTHYNLDMMAQNELPTMPW
jgi:hypothetical protein